MLRPAIDRDAPTDNAGLRMARSIRDVVRAHAADSERLRTLDKATVDALWQSGLMQLQPLAATPELSRPGTAPQRACGSVASNSMRRTTI